jgi:hypothetical protein
VQKTDHPVPRASPSQGSSCIDSATDCVLARVVVSSDGDDSAEALALSFQSFLYDAPNSMLRKLSFYDVILRVFSRLSKFTQSSVEA